jgi:hypothetical protein
VTIHGLCRQCGVVITYVEPGLDPRYHVTCGPNLNAGPNSLFVDSDGSQGHNESMQRDLTEVIQWAYRSQPRTRQVMLGPSQLGEPCARKIAYQVAGTPSLNKAMDPWPALVGTAVHAWLEQAIGKFQAEAGAVRWLTETTVQVDDMVTGHVDLYDIETSTVWDFKTLNSDNIKKYRENGPIPNYRTQVHLYGMGMINAGHPVDRVGLIGLPRSGWLSGMWVWSEVYDEQIAARALSRMYGIAEQVLELAVDEHPDQFMAIEATPSQLCTLCEFYRPDVPGGCPAK